jgi:hypothetical protein
MFVTIRGMIFNTSHFVEIRYDRVLTKEGQIALDEADHKSLIEQINLKQFYVALQAENAQLRRDIQLLKNPDSVLEEVIPTKDSQQESVEQLIEQSFEQSVEQSIETKLTSLTPYLSQKVDKKNSKKK